MHYEKNLKINLIKTILGEKDSKRVQFDFQASGVRESY
jgi:hypothetical protein